VERRQARYVRSNHERTHEKKQVKKIRRRKGGGDREGGRSASNGRKRQKKRKIDYFARREQIKLFSPDQTQPAETLIKGRELDPNKRRTISIKRGEKIEETELAKTQPKM